MYLHRENLSKRNKIKTSTGEKIKIATKRNTTIENIYRNMRSVMLCLVYTFVFRSDVLWCVAFYVLQYTTTIPITSHHVTYYSTFNTKKTPIYICFDILIFCCPPFIHLTSNKKTTHFSAKNAQFCTKKPLSQRCVQQKNDALYRVL